MNWPLFSPTLSLSLFTLILLPEAYWIIWSWSILCGVLTAFILTHISLYLLGTPWCPYFLDYFLTFFLLFGVNANLGYLYFQFSAVAQSCPTLCDPMDCSTPGLPVHHQLPEFTQTHFHWVGDTIQPSHPLSSPSPPAFGLSLHQCLFKWVSSSHQVAKVLEFQLQHQFSQWIFRTDFL